MDDAWQKDLYDRSLKTFGNLQDLKNKVKTKSPEVQADWADELSSLTHEITITLGQANMKICETSLSFINSFRSSINSRPQNEVNSVINDLEQLHNRIINLAKVEIDEFDFMRTRCNYPKEILAQDSSNFPNAEDMRPELERIKSLLISDRNKLIEAKNQMENLLKSFPLVNIRDTITQYQQTTSEDILDAKWKELGRLLKQTKPYQTDAVSQKINDAKIKYTAALLAVHERVKFLPDIVLDYFTHKPNRLWTRTIYMFDEFKLEKAKTNLRQNINSFNEFKLNVTNATRQKKATKDQVQWIDAEVKLIEADIILANKMKIEVSKLPVETIDHLITILKAYPWTDQSSVNEFFESLVNFKVYCTFAIRRVPISLFDSEFDYKNLFFDLIREKVCNIGSADKTQIQGIINKVYNVWITKDNEALLKNIKELIKPFVELSSEILGKLMEMRRIVKSRPEIRKKFTKKLNDLQKEIIDLQYKVYYKYNEVLQDNGETWVYHNLLKSKIDEFFRYVKDASHEHGNAPPRIVENIPDKPSSDCFCM